ncbi:hypothetical protein AAKU58_004456, partial [Oxalobacteraceae bacterium GrIS 1.18]
GATKASRVAGLFAFVRNKQLSGRSPSKFK